MLSNASFATLVPINDMYKAIKFYTKVLGGTVTLRVNGKMKNSWAAVKIGREQFWLIKRAKKSDVAYSTFVVKNIESTVAGLKKKGVRFLRAERESYMKRVEGPIAFHSYGAEAFFKDSEGNLLMLWQDAWHFEKSQTTESWIHLKHSNDSQILSWEFNIDRLLLKKPNLDSVVDLIIFDLLHMTEKCAD